MKDKLVEIIKGFSVSHPSGIHQGIEDKLCEPLAQAITDYLNKEGYVKRSEIRLDEGKIEKIISAIPYWRAKSFMDWKRQVIHTIANGDVIKEDKI